MGYEQVGTEQEGGMHAGADLIGCMPIAGEPRESKQVNWRELYCCMLVVTDLLVGWLVSVD
jgi:hypothetical protein